MTSNTHPPLHLIVAYDMSELAHRALVQAVEIAAADPRYVLHFITVLDEDGAPLPSKGKPSYSDAEELYDYLKSELEHWLGQQRPETSVRFFVHVRLGSPAEEILQLATEMGAYMIVVGSHSDEDAKRAHMGSVARKVLDNAECPVVVVRERKYESARLFEMAPREPAHEEYERPHRYSYTSGLMEPLKPSYPWY